MVCRTPIDPDVYHHCLSSLRTLCILLPLGVTYLALVHPHHIHGIQLHADNLRFLSWCACGASIIKTTHCIEGWKARIVLEVLIDRQLNRRILSKGVVVHNRILIGHCLFVCTPRVAALQDHLRILLHHVVQKTSTQCTELHLACVLGLKHLAFVLQLKI